MAMGTVTLIGSGELSPTLGKVHRGVMGRIDGPVRAVILDTPAGFQLNADHLGKRASEYFERSLATRLEVASFKSATEATADEMEALLRRLERANYYFAGPGSPTYAIRNWRGTAVIETLSRRLASGAHLVFASAASIAMGRYALPVYEIYKVGAEVEWVEGLDLLGPYGLELAIVPHWNNAEGGNHDTRYCFMGAPRLARLEAALPTTAMILGIDEYTACTLDLATGEAEVIGNGQVTLRREGREASYPAGTSFGLGRLTEAGESWSPAPLLTAAGENEVREKPKKGTEAWVDAGELINLLVAVRAQLREAGVWGPADAIRDRLSELGIIVEDRRGGSTWRRAE